MDGNISHFVNADAIAVGLSAFAPEAAAIQAGRAMLNRIKYLANENATFAFETTLASRSFAPWINNLKKSGYLFHLTFLVLDSAELAIFRVSERVKMGGHFVPDDTVRRRYISGLKNFFTLYSPIADSWQMYDNSVSGCLRSIASKLNNQLVIDDQIMWNKLTSLYNESTN